MQSTRSLHTPSCSLLTYTRHQTTSLLQRPVPICQRHQHEHGLSPRARQLAVTCAAQQSAVPLTEDENAARKQFLDHYQQGDSSAEQQAIDLLTEAAKERQVPGRLVVGALSHLEGSSHSNGSDAIDSLQGRWQLVFGSKAPAPFLQYIPVREVADIDVATRSIDLASEIGPLSFCFLGNFDWKAPDNMRFAFEELRVTLGQRQVYSKTWQVEEGQRKEYQYFYVNDAIAAVRSSLGGHILMLKEQKIKSPTS